MAVDFLVDPFGVLGTKEAKKKKDESRKKKPDSQKSTGTLPSDAATDAEKGITVGQSNNDSTLSGLKSGTEIKGGGKAELQKGAGANAFAVLEPTDRAALLLNLGRIPNLYSPGTAPTPGFISKMLKDGQVVPRMEDFAAYEKIIAHAEWAGDTPNNSIIKFANNPGLAEQFFGKVSSVPKAVTSPAALQAELDSKFLDIFETKADSKIAKEYAREINALESTRAGAGTQQKEDILLKYIQKKANELGPLPGAADKGSLGRVVRTIRSAYDDNGIPINEKDIYNKAIQSLRSRDAEKNIIDGIMMQASTVMPALKEGHRRGESSRQQLSPWISTRARILGISEDQVKTSDMYEVASGAVAIPIPEYKKIVYGSTEFKTSEAYKERSLNDKRTMLRAFNVGTGGL
jgi:hypothetical protein